MSRLIDATMSAGGEKERNAPGDVRAEIGAAVGANKLEVVDLS